MNKTFSYYHYFFKVSVFMKQLCTNVASVENPALQRASPVLALTLYFPTPSTSALYLSVLSSMPALYLYSVTRHL